ncbi:MAG: hypothetical protein K2J60_18055 [Acetatifactor sp.]|nr:hypothetical protein [Acetatifactor sp.]
MMALTSAPLTESWNNQFFLPIHNVLMARYLQAAVLPTQKYSSTSDFWMSAALEVFPVERDLSAPPPVYRSM